MSRWFLKVGNSRVVLWDGRNRKLSLPTSSLKVKILLQSKKISELYFISVVPQVSKKIIVECRKQNLHVREVQLVDIPIRSTYSKKLGVDRLMNVYAGSLLTKKSFAVIDLGTALTVDFFSRSKGHLGGWISAGPHLLAKALNEFTAKLPYVTPKLSQKLLGQTTEDSLLIGQREFLKGMINQVEAVGAEIFKKNFEIFVTGGGSDLLPGVRLRRVNDLSLMGLKKLCENL